MKGARCKYSEEGRACFSRSQNLDRLGTIIGEGYGQTCWRVLWDGRKASGVDAIAKSYITVLELVQ